MERYKEYFETKKLIEELGNKLLDMQSEIIKELRDSDGPVKNEFGTFTRVVQKRIHYSDHVEEAEKRIKDQVKAMIVKESKEVEKLKEYEVLKNIAVVEDVEILRHTQVKK